MDENYQLFGLDENASDEELKERYSELKKKYNEERWEEGEVGNNAARMLGKLDNAYVEIMTKRRESERNTASNSGSVLDDVAKLIKDGELVEAQSKLDNCNERSAEWHYLQSVLFFRKNWMNESKKQLEIAMQMDGSNYKYKDAYDRLTKRMNGSGEAQQPNGGGQGAYDNNTGNTQSVHPEEEQMGGSECSECLDCCGRMICINCLFNLCCGCR